MKPGRRQNRFCVSLRVGPQPPGAVGLTRLDDIGRRMFVINVEPNEPAYCELPVQVGHGAFKRPRILTAARWLRFHSFCRLECKELLVEYGVAFQ